MAIDTVLGSNRHGYQLGSAVATTMPISMACWANIPSPGATFHTLITLISSASNLHNIQVQVDGTQAGDPVIANTQDGGVRARGSSAATTGGVWMHCGAVFTGSGGNVTSRTAYLNGVAGTPDTTSHTPVGLDLTDFGIEAGSAWGEALLGRMAEAAVWTAALTASDMAKLALGWSPRRVSLGNLVSYVKLRDSTTPGPRTLIGEVGAGTWTETALQNVVNGAGSWSAGVATLTMLLAPATWRVGQLIRVAGVTPSGYNTAKAPISAISGNDFSYPLASDPGAWVSDGTMELRVSRGRNPIEMTKGVGLLI